MCLTPLSFSALRTISAPVILISSLPVISKFPSLRFPRDIKFQGIKKGPRRSLVLRMGAFAGWLHHPAHAPAYHKNVCDLDHHRAVISAKFRIVNWTIAKFATIYEGSMPIAHFPFPVRMRP